MAERSHNELRILQALILCRSKCHCFSSLYPDCGSDVHWLAGLNNRPDVLDQVYHMTAGKWAQHNNPTVDGIGLVSWMSIQSAGEEGFGERADMIPVAWLNLFWL